MLRRLFHMVHGSLNGRYGVVVAASLCVETAVFALVLRIPDSELWASSVATSVAFVVNFFGHVHYTFRDNKAGARKQFEFLAFKLLMVGLRNALYVTLIKAGGLGPWASFGIIVVLSVSVFAISKAMVAGITLRNQILSAWTIAKIACKRLWAWMSAKKPFRR